MTNDGALWDSWYGKPCGTCPAQCAHNATSCSPLPIGYASCSCSLRAASLGNAPATHFPRCALALASRSALAQPQGRAIHTHSGAASHGHAWRTSSRVDRPAAATSLAGPPRLASPLSRRHGAQLHARCFFMKATSRSYATWTCAWSAWWLFLAFISAPSGTSTFMKAWPHAG